MKDIISKIVNINGEKFVFGTLSDVYLKQKKDRKRHFEVRLGKALLGHFKKNVDDLVKKLLDLKSLSAVKYGEYHQMLSEAIVCYILGNYKATIACCGITAELISFELLIKNKPSIISEEKFQHMSQHSRLVLLFMTNKIRQPEFQKLDKIRSVRNQYIHNPKTIPVSHDQKNAKLCINNLVETIKVIYKP